MHKLLLFCALLFFTPASEWKLRKEKSGIQVFTRLVDGSTFEEFKAVTTVENATISDILSILFDIPGFQNLFPDCLEVRLIEQKEAYHTVHYIVTKGPGPVDDRDAVYEQKAKFSQDRQKVKITITTLNDIVPQTEKIVRMIRGSGFWELEQLENDIVNITFQFHGEPGGNVPAWIANTFIVSHPFETVENLKDRLTKQKKN